jgi:FkbM family methyltransferase
MLSLFRTLASFRAHPLAGRRWRATVLRYLRWQISSRVLNVPHLLPYTDHAQLWVQRGGSAAINQYYYGIAEFAEQCFAAHLLRRDDLFVDVGANVGVFTILVASFTGCRVTAVEPATSEADQFERNVLLNGLQQHVQLHRLAAADRARPLVMTRDWADGNQVWENLDDNQQPITAPELANTATVSVDGAALDTLIDTPCALLKIDVEGFEFRVLAGAQRVLGDPALKAVLIENSLQGHGGELAPPILETLASHGFLPAHYDPRTRHLRALGHDEKPGFNVIAVRDFDFVRERVLSAPPIGVLGERI